MEKARYKGSGTENPNTCAGICHGHRVMSVLAVLTVCIFVLLALFIPLISFYMMSQNPNHGGIQRLGNVLSTSFSMELDIYSRQENKWLKDADVKYFMESDFETFDFRYTKSVVLHDLIVDVHLNITIVNDQAISSAFDGFAVTTSCHSDVYAEGFFYIMMMASNATLKSDLGKVKDNCAGRIWSIPNCNGEIYFCENNSILVWVIQEDMRADVMKWESKSAKTIQLPQYNDSCHIVYPEQYKDTNCLGDETHNVADETQPQQLNAKKDCFFMHGVGVESQGDPYVVASSHANYWGNIQSKTPQCKSHNFIIMDTINFGWDNKVLHDNVCDILGDGDKRIRNKVIFSHSMGNLIVGGALFRNVCSLDKDSSRWYTIQAPWRGSKAADVLSKFCSGSFSSGFLNFVSHHARNLLVSLNYCTTSRKSTMAFESLKTNYVSTRNITFQDVVNTAKRLSHGAMCGDSAGGLWKNWLTSIALKFVQGAVKLPKPNDGVVSGDSCRIGSNYGGSIENNYYSTRANHLEGTCRYGDLGWAPPGWKMDKPCSWYTRRQT